MAQTPGSASTQHSIAVTFSSSQSAGTLITIGGDEGTLAVEPEKSFQSLVVSTPWFSAGDEVSVYRDGSVLGSSTAGLFSDGSIDNATFLDSATLSSIVSAITL